MRRLWVALLLALLVLAVAEVQAADVGAGKAVYDRLCVACHGPGGVGATGSPLNTAAFAQKFDTVAKLRAVTQRGAPGMPAFGTELLKDSDIENLSAYLLSLGLGSGTAAPTTAAAAAAVGAPAASPVAATAPLPLQATQPAQTISQTTVPVGQVYVLAVITLAAINAIVMFILWKFINRKPLP